MLPAKRPRTQPLRSPSLLLFLEGWREWGGHLNRLSRLLSWVGKRAYRRRCCASTKDCTLPGGMVASLSIPWGNAHNDPGGYHLVWTRDAVEATFGLLAAGEMQDASRILAYLAATQRPDGGWYQNFFPDSRPYRTGVQLDEAGFPIPLPAKLREVGVPETAEAADMVVRAAGFVATNGPVSLQDRWEENPGASPFTLAVEVAALVAAVPWVEAADAAYALELADCWNERIEEGTYVQEGDLCKRFGVDGYYIRIGPEASAGGLRGQVEVRNTPGVVVPAEALVGLEFIYLARLAAGRPARPPGAAERGGLEAVPGGDGVHDRFPAASCRSRSGTPRRFRRSGSSLGYAVAGSLCTTHWLGRRRRPADQVGLLDRFQQVIGSPTRVSRTMSMTRTGPLALPPDRSCRGPWRRVTRITRRDRNASRRATDSWLQASTTLTTVGTAAPLRL